MLIIQYDDNSYNFDLGGYGDRIVGLISIKLISQLLNRPFYINWSKENIKQYFDYSKYDYDLIDNIKNNGMTSRERWWPKCSDSAPVCEYNFINNQPGLRNHLLNSIDLFPNNINIFRINVEIAQYLYKNKLFCKKNNFIEDILHEYTKLYTDILIPTPFLNNKINKLFQNINMDMNIVGIQIRCGDCYMVTNKNETHTLNIEHIIDKLLNNIKQFCNNKFKEYYIFITSDNSNIYDKCINVFDTSRVIYNNDIIQHLDRKSVKDDISKIFVDNFILSQKTDILFITDDSNYGRIVALSCKHDNIYSIYNKKIDKINLLSKGEMIFT